MEYSNLWASIPKKIIIITLAVASLGAIFHGLGLIKLVPWHWVYSDLLGFYERISPPGLPYVDKFIEYPVLTGVFMQVMTWLGQGRAGYYIVSALALLAIIGLSTWLIWKITPENNRQRLWVYWVFAPSMLFFSFLNWDFLAIFFVLAAFYFYDRQKFNLSAVMLALGFAAKFYPAIYLPLLVFKIKDWAGRVKAALAFTATAVAVNIGFALANFDGWSFFFRLNSERTSNNDSIWTIFRFLFGEIGIPTINNLSLILFLTGFIYIFWKLKNQPFAHQAFATTVLFLLVNKVFSPQYILWLLPFFVLVEAPRLGWFYALEFSNLAAFFITLRWFFLGQNIVYFYWAMPFVIIRHFVLSYILYLLLRDNARLPRKASQ